MTPSSSPIKLRGHHLICLHFFHGEGYDPGFVTNLRKLMQRVAAGKEIEVHAGADDVCEACPHLRNRLCVFEEGTDDAISEMDRRALTLLKIAPGDRLRWSDIKGKVPAIFDAWYTSYCLRCDWKAACEKTMLFSNRQRNKDEKTSDKF